MKRVLGAVRWLLAGLGLLLLVVTLTPLDSWWATALAGPWNDPPGDVLIVLGGSVLEDGLIGSSSYWRSVYAVRAWKEGGFRLIILSGGGASRTSAAESMRDFLVGQGVPLAAVQLETRSHSTRENALFAKPILEGMAGRKVLLTSDYHMFRASRVFRKAGIQVLPRPFPDARKRARTPLSRWSAFIDLCIETTKICVYYFRGWI
jgi:uncharacterized SAM-binding protein YcdF (DUF218 family)